MARAFARCMLYFMTPRAPRHLTRCTPHSNSQRATRMQAPPGSMRGAVHAGREREHRKGQQSQLQSAQLQNDVFTPIEFTPLFDK